MRIMTINDEQSFSREMTRLKVKLIPYPDQSVLIIRLSIVTDSEDSFGKFLNPCLLNLFAREDDHRIQNLSNCRNRIDGDALFSFT